MPRIALTTLTVFLAIGCLAQDSSTGAIHGLVVDAGGGRIPGATLAFVNLSTGQSYSGTTDAQGWFAFELLPPGNYSGRAEFPKMSPQTTPPLHVDVGGVTEVEFKLAVEGTKETVTVTGAPPMVETQPSAVSSLIDETAIANLPLNGRRYTDLALLTPGVTQDPRGLMSGSNGDLAFGGIRGFQSSYLVDGGDNNNGFFVQARGRYREPYQLSNEVVQEFRVSSSTYGAETGRAGGAVVNVVTKSGSNQMHGTAFYFMRDSMFSATQEFMDFKPHDQQQQFGFTLGGPLRRNRTFFFAGWDQHLFHVPAVVRFDNGSSVVTPQPAPNPATPGDYDPSDQALVFASAAQLSQQAGTFPASMVGNAGFLKLDTALSQHNNLSLRVNTSRYFGNNNVFLDTASPQTTFGISDNGEEQVWTETATLSLTSNFSFHVVGHLRAQFSRDQEQSTSNSSDPLTRIPTVIDGFGRASILPRQTREHRLHIAETLSLEGGRHSWKLGGDALLTWTYDFFPSSFGGEYIFDPIKVNPYTFVPQEGGLELTPLRAYAHQVPHYYLQGLGSAVTNPDSNEYSGFLQDSIRVTEHFGLSLGARYDLQTFATKNLVSNPLWPDSGKVPLNSTNFVPRIGVAYSIGKERPLVIRAGYGLFYTRIPQIYTSAVESENGLTPDFLFLNNTNVNDRQIFPQYPNPLVNCPANAATCNATPSLTPYVEANISAFAHNFKTPKAEQASLSLEREMAPHLAVGLSYLYVHGIDLIRALDANLPPPVDVVYPVYDSTGNNFLGSYYNVASFSTWQFTDSLECPFPPCINPLARPVPQLGSIDVFQSAASSVYHGATLSIRRRMNHGLYFMLSYTFAHAVDDGQDALVAGRPATVQNAYSPNAEKGPSTTDQRHRFVFSWVAEPRPFDRSHASLAALFNRWKVSGVTTIGSGRPVSATVSGDANQDGNDTNDRLPGTSRNSLIGPDYASTEMRLARRFYLGDHLKLELTAESFNLFNRDNPRTVTTSDGFVASAAQFVQTSNQIGINYFPAQYRLSTNFLHPTSAYAPRQVQFGLRLIF
ncbi:MAG TPA: carboxypeptidase regulatory-like domain-containing protein [Terriglobales bacterium]|nr:carboxypeptidase regulatory-like domain-containing protein [Terriglobales bacterium]